MTTVIQVHSGQMSLVSPVGCCTLGVNWPLAPKIGPSHPKLGHGGAIAALFFASHRGADVISI